MSAYTVPNLTIKLYYNTVPRLVIIVLSLTHFPILSPALITRLIPFQDLGKDPINYPNVGLIIFPGEKQCPIHINLGRTGIRLSVTKVPMGDFQLVLSLSSGQPPLYNAATIYFPEGGRFPRFFPKRYMTFSRTQIPNFSSKPFSNKYL